ncbi:MAG: hypothetical protein NC335_04090 [Bacteroides sp.]|nr:hypothetical protein [Bacteroides sp.]
MGLTLFVFEGASTESILVSKLEQNFLGDRHAIKCVFDAEIYQLYNSMKDDEPFQLDIVNLLKERRVENAEILKGYTRDSFAYIYLFFDYDAHAPIADDEKVREMLSFFDNETENGMLYISYPMVEAMRHFKDIESFKSLIVKCKRRNCPYVKECTNVEDCLKEPHYKKFVPQDSKPQLSNVNSYTKEVWKELITAHLCKANYLVHDKFILPASLISQREIFAKQIEKHINHKCPKVAVLSAFPLYVLDYYGCKKIMVNLKP